MTSQETTGGRVRFHHDDGDFNGDITIEGATAVSGVSPEGSVTVEVPFDAMRELVYRYLVWKRVMAFEDSHSADAMETALFGQPDPIRQELRELASYLRKRDEELLAARDRAHGDGRNTDRSLHFELQAGEVRSLADRIDRLLGPR